MPPKKGTTSNNPNGRPKGSPNRDTAKVRLAVADLLNANADNLSTWLDAVAQESPEKAIKLVTDLLEYAMPKLARTEMQHLDAEGKPADQAVSKIVIEHVQAPKA